MSGELLNHRFFRHTVIDGISRMAPIDGSALVDFLSKLPPEYIQDGMQYLDTTYNPPRRMQRIDGQWIDVSTVEDIFTNA